MPYEPPVKVNFSQSDFTGCAFYRMEAPHRHLSSIGVDSRIGFLPQIGPTLNEDICVIQRQYHPEAFQAILHKRQAGIRIVGELDDDFWHLPVSNPAYFKYSPAVIAEAERNAKEKGEIGQDVKFLRIKSALGDFFRCCDAVTVPTPTLAVQLRQFCKCVGVLPNYLDDSLWRKFPAPPKPLRTCRIMWTGSDSHAGDIEPAFRAVKRILDNYPHTKFVVFGWIPPMMEMFPSHRVEVYAGFQKVQQYFEFLTETPIHIGLAPLAPTAFNKSKSPIKKLEYGAMGAAPVVQDMAPYQYFDKGKDHVGFVGKFTEEAWYRALVPYVENPQMTLEKATEWQKTVLENYTYSKNIHKWVEFYNKVRARKQNTWFPKNAPIRVNPDGSPVGGPQNGPR